jgi:hypothetical protein
MHYRRHARGDQLMPVMLRQRSVSRRAGDLWELDDAGPLPRLAETPIGLFAKSNLRVYLSGSSQFWRDELKAELTVVTSRALPATMLRRSEFQEDEGRLTVVSFKQYEETDDDIGW